MRLNNRILILTLSMICLITVDCSKHKKDGQVLKKEEKEIKKKVSSSRVPNGGRKGPMSGGSWDSTLSIASLPVILPLPKKKKKEKKESQRREKAKEIKHEKQQKLEKNKKRQDRKKPQMTETDMNPKTKRSTREFLDSHEVVQRIRRNIDDSLFTDEERKLREEWLQFDEHASNIPSVETANFLPDDFKFIYDAGKTLVDAYKTLKPDVKSNPLKRSVDEEEEEEEEENDSQQNDEKLHDDEDQIIEKRDVTDYDMVADDDVISEENVARDMRVREILPEDEYSEEVTEIVNENSDYREPIYHTIVTRDVPINNGNCKAEEDALDNAIKASKVVDNIVAQLGIKKETIIEDTRKCIEKTQKVTRDFNDRFRRHIIHARDLVDARVHKRREIEELKQMFDSDQKEAEKISTESELCSKIKMQFTILEVAEYYALSNAKEKLQKCRSSLPTSNNNFHFANVMPVTYPTPFTPNVITYPQPQVVQTPSFPFANVQMFRQAEPVTLQSQLPSIGSFFEPQKTPEQPLVQSHEIGMQRHFDTAPNPSNHLPPVPASVLHQPHLQSHSYEVNRQSYGHPLAFNRLENYGEMVRQNYQISKDAQNMFKYNNGVGEQLPYANNLPPLGYFNTEPAHLTTMQHVSSPLKSLPPLPNAYLQPPNQFVNAGQKNIAEYPLKQYSPSTIINSFSGKNKNKLSHPDHHHSTTDSNQENKGEDWQSSLWFPGTTYSPPPSWLQPNPSQQEPQKEPSVPFQFQPNENQYPQHFTPSKSPMMPFVPPQQKDNHPSISQIAGEKHKEGEPGMVAPFSTLKPYNPFKQFTQQPQRFFKPPPGATSVLPNAPIIQSYTGRTQNQAFSAPSVMTNSYAAPQNAHEIINAGPGTEVITINKKPPIENQNKQVGQLPDYLLAVDMAKYPVDSTDRLRDGNQNNNNETEKNDNENEKGPKREFPAAGTIKSNVDKAVKSVDYVAESTGFSPHGVEVLINSVKETVKREITLSESLLNKDAEMEKEFCGQEQANINNVAQKSELDKRSEIRSLACENVKKKHGMDKVQLEEAKDRKNKIAQMEMIQTEIEVAKYFAQITKGGGDMKNIDVGELVRASRSPSPLQQ